jgi:hypothetical protein
VRSKDRKKRSTVRELAAHIARIPLDLWNSGGERLPNVGLILFPTVVGKSMPSGVKGYGQGIGLLGTALIGGLKFVATEIEQVPGSEFRTSKLNLAKVLDVFVSYRAVWQGRISIRSEINSELSLK